MLVIILILYQIVIAISSRVVFFVRHLVLVVLLIFDQNFIRFSSHVVFLSQFHAFLRAFSPRFASHGIAIIS